MSSFGGNLNRLKKIDIHAAVTAYEQVSPIQEAILLGVKRGTGERELGQFAVELFPRQLPIKEEHFRELFKALGEKCLEKAREAGLTRP